MDLTRRGQTLCRLIEQSVSIESFPTDLALVSRLRGTSILPVDALLHHPLLSKFRPTESDIIGACSQSPILNGKIVFCPDACVVLPFFVDPRVLIVSNMPDAKQAEFRSYLALLLGHKYFEVHPNNQKGSFRTRFADTATAFCVWRALNYCAFKGEMLSVCPVASLVPIEELERLKPIPVHKKRASTSERKRRQMMRNAKKLDDLPAVVPMASVIMGMSQLPQAACIEREQRQGR